MPVQLPYGSVTFFTSARFFLTPGLARPFHLDQVGGEDALLEHEASSEFPVNHWSYSSRRSRTGMRLCTGATAALASVIAPE